VLSKNVEDTKALYKSSGSSYLEVLTAETQLLSAQLNKVSADFNKMQTVVSLYTALGGGGK
jgi:outer membrane protein TolC